jgi:hypothetical protein
VAVLPFGAAFAAAGQSLPEFRMTPQEIRESAQDSNQIGSSGREQRALCWIRHGRTRRW